MVTVGGYDYVWNGNGMNAQKNEEKKEKEECKKQKERLKKEG